MRLSRIFSTLLLLVLSGGSAFAQSDMERRFLKEMDKLVESGDRYYDAGYTLQSEWFYGQAVVGIRSFQYALDRIAYALVKQREEAQDKAHEDALRAYVDKGPEKIEANEEASEILGFDVNAMLEGLNSFSKVLMGVSDKMEEKAEVMEKKLEEMGFDVDGAATVMSDRWRSLSSLSIVSPYPFFFEGIVLDMCGDRNKARTAYACAVCNPYIMRGLMDFTFLSTLSLEEVQSLWWRLENHVTGYLDRVRVSANPFPRDWRSWNSAYLVSKGAEILGSEGSVSSALPWFDAAVAANPFDAGMFVSAAAAHMMMGDAKGAAYYINQGLLLDPDNADLMDMAGDLM